MAKALIEEHALLPGIGMLLVSVVAGSRTADGSARISGRGGTCLRSLPTVSTPRLRRGECQGGKPKSYRCHRDRSKHTHMSLLLKDGAIMRQLDVNG